MDPSPPNLPKRKSRRVLVPVLVLGAACTLVLCWMLVQAVLELGWKPTLQSYIPRDAHNVRFGGSTSFLTIEGVCSFSSSPAALDKLESGGFTDVTADLSSFWGRAWRSELDDVTRRHLGLSLDSLGPVRIYQKTLREDTGFTEEAVVVETAARDKALLYYLYQQ